MLPNTKRWNSHVSHVDSISAGKEQCIELRDKTSLALCKARIHDTFRYFESTHKRLPNNEGLCAVKSPCTHLK